MKKIGVFFLSAVLILSMSGCWGRNKTPETEPTVNTTVPATQPPTSPIMPDPEPTLETNIPDPNVDSTMPTMGDATDSTGSTEGGMNEGQNPEISPNTRSRRGH